MSELQEQAQAQGIPATVNVQKRRSSYSNDTAGPSSSGITANPISNGKKSRNQQDMQLKPVNAVSIRILVDNNIERFAELPIGFLDETPQQLANNPPIDTKITGLPIMDLDHFCCGAHGLGVLITTKSDDNEEHTVLFDAGPDAKALERNVDALRPDMSKVERIILSHWHADHSGGIPAAIKLINEATLEEQENPRRKVAVDLHPGRPIARGNARNGQPVARQAAGPTFDELEKLGAQVDLQKAPHTVANDTVFVSGEIPRVTSFETGFLNGIEWVEGADGKGEWNKELGELVQDERYVVVDVLNQGLVVFSACSHAGIVNVIKDVRHYFPDRPVHTILGGLHLGGKNMEYRIQSTVDFFAKELGDELQHLLPLHCSGFKARVALSNALGDVCVAGGVGMRIDIGN